MSKTSASQRVKIIGLLISAVIALLFLEVGLQGYYRLTMHSWLWSYNAFHVTFVDSVPDRRQYALRKGFSDLRSGVTINQNGLRTAQGINEPDKVTPVVVSIGDSKAFGSGVKDEETYEYYLDAQLRDAASQFRVVNGGVPSYNTRQAIDRFNIDILPNYNVKLVTFHAPFNDISLLTFYREKWDADKTWADIRHKEFREPLPFIQYSAILYFANKIFSSRRDSNASDAAQGVNYKYFSDDAMIANLRTEIDAFLSECERRSIPVILMPIDPFYYQTANLEKNESLPLWKQNHQYVDIWKNIINDYDNLLPEMSKSHSSVYFLDTRKIMDYTERGEMFVDAIHYSAKGNKFVSDAIHDLIKKERLLEQIQ